MQKLSQNLCAHALDILKILSLPLLIIIIFPSYYIIMWLVCVVMCPFSTLHVIPCSISQTRHINGDIFLMYTGPPGRTTVFQNVPSGLYSLRVTATADMDEEEVIWKVYVPTTSSICSVNPINAGLVVDGTSVSMEFRGVGSTSGFICRLDNGRFSSCELCTVDSLFMNHN